MSSSIGVIYETKTGNTKTFVEYLEEAYPEVNFIVVEAGEDLTKVLECDKIFIGCYTWRNGKIPIKMKDLIILNRDALLEKSLFLFGSGITIYRNFCGAVDGMNTILESGRQIPNAKFELTFLPDEHSDNRARIDKFLGVV